MATATKTRKTPVVSADVDAVVKTARKPRVAKPAPVEAAPEADAAPVAKTTRKPRVVKPAPVADVAEAPEAKTARKPRVSAKAKAEAAAAELAAAEADAAKALAPFVAVRFGDGAWFTSLRSGGVYSNPKVDRAKRFKTVEAAKAFMVKVTAIWEDPAGFGYVKVTPQASGKIVTRKVS